MNTLLHTTLFISLTTVTWAGVGTRRSHRVRTEHCFIKIFDIVTCDHREQSLILRLNTSFNPTLWTGTMWSPRMITRLGR